MSKHTAIRKDSISKTGKNITGKTIHITYDHDNKNHYCICGKFPYNFDNIIILDIIDTNHGKELNEETLHNLRRQAGQILCKKCDEHISAIVRKAEAKTIRTNNFISACEATHHDTKSMLLGVMTAEEYYERKLNRFDMELIHKRINELL